MVIENLARQNLVERKKPTKLVTEVYEETMEKQ